MLGYIRIATIVSERLWLLKRFIFKVYYLNVNSIKINFRIETFICLKRSKSFVVVDVQYKCIENIFRCYFRLTH